MKIMAIAGALLLTNLLGLALLLARLRAAAHERLVVLRKRALFCLLASGLGVAFSVASGAVAILRASSASVDVSRQAELLAGGISEVMNGLGAGLVALPLPLAAAIVTFVRARRTQPSASRSA